MNFSIIGRTFIAFLLGNPLALHVPDKGHQVFLVGLHLIEQIFCSGQFVGLRLDQLFPR